MDDRRLRRRDGSVTCSRARLSETTAPRPRPARARGSDGGTNSWRRVARPRSVPARTWPLRARRFELWVAARRICVHGDYDVDGICATALAVLILRELGADVGQHLPSRFEEGYGVAHETLSRLAGEERLVLTVDCGITAVAEIAASRAAASTSSSPIITCRVGRSPTALSSRLVRRRTRFQSCAAPGSSTSSARRYSGATPRSLDRHLDLVAATIADVVPLVDENRALAIAGLRRSQGLRSRASGR